MKKIILFAFAMTLGIAFASAQTATPANATTEPAKVVNPNAPIAKWDKTTNDMGEIEQGIPKEFQFKLTNAGKEPLIIQSARPGCGCTNMKYSQEPILPGKTTIVAATYNAAAMGAFTKTVTVTTNADTAPVTLIIKGTVVEKKEQPQTPQQ